ncbi:hypothetical protein ABPG73_017119 [Tetrahymena malaccensis]
MMRDYTQYKNIINIFFVLGVLLSNLSSSLGIQCPNLVVYQSVAILQQFTPINFVLIHKTSIIVINTASNTSEQNNIIYYVDLQSTEFQVLNSIKPSFQIQKMVYIEPIDQILLWNYAQVLLVNPYNLSPTKQIALQYIKSIDLIQNSLFALITAETQIFLIHQITLDIIMIMSVYDSQYYQLMINQYCLYFQNLKQQNVLLVVTNSGVQVWSVNLNTFDQKFFGYIQQTFLPFQIKNQFIVTKHPNYDLIIVGSQFLQVQFIQVSEIYQPNFPTVFDNKFIPDNPNIFVNDAILIPKNKADPNSKDLLLMTFNFDIFSAQIDFWVDQNNNIHLVYISQRYIQQIGGYGWYYLPNLQKILLGFKFSARIYDISTATSQDILQLFSDANNRRYIVEYQNQEYFAYINPNGFFVADRSYQNRRVFKKNDPPYPYIMKHGTFFQVKGCPLCFVIVCNQGGLTDTRNVYIATTQLFPIQQPYQFISLAPFNIGANTMTLNLDPFFYDNTVWVAIGVSYTQNNLGCIFLLLNIKDSNSKFCLRSPQQDENNSQSMYAIVSLKDINRQEIIGITKNGMLYRWDLQTKNLFKSTQLEFCYDSLYGNIYHHVLSDNSINKYFITVCQNLYTQVVDLQKQITYTLSQSNRAQSSVINVFESIGLIAIGSNNGQAYLFRFNNQTAVFDFFMQIGSSKVLEQIIFMQLVSQNTLWIQHIYRDVYYPIDSCLQDINNCLNCQYDFYFQATEMPQNNGFYGTGDIKQPYTSSNSLFTALLKSYNQVRLKDIEIIFNLLNYSEALCGIALSNLQSVVLDNIQIQQQNVVGNKNCYLIQVDNSYLQLYNYYLFNKTLNQVPQLFLINNSTQILMQNFTIDSCSLNPGFAVMTSSSDIYFRGRQINIINNNCTESLQNNSTSSLFSAGQFYVTDVNIIKNNLTNIKLFSVVPSLLQTQYCFFFENINLISNHFLINTKQILFNALYSFLPEPDHNFTLQNANFNSNRYFSPTAIDTRFSSSIQNSFMIQTEKIKNINIQNVNFTNHQEISLMELKFSTLVNISVLNCFDLLSKGVQIQTIIGCLSIQEANKIILDQLQFQDKTIYNQPLLIINSQLYQDSEIDITNSIFENLQLYQTLPSSQVNPLQITVQGRLTTILIQNCTFQQNALISSNSVLVYSVTSLWVQNVEGLTIIQQSKFLNCSSNSVYNNMYIQSTNLTIFNSLFNYSSFQLKDQLVQNQLTQKITNEGGFIRANIQYLNIQNSQFSNSVSQKGSFIFIESFEQVLYVKIENSNFTNGYSTLDGSAFYFNLPNSNLTFECLSCNFNNFYNCYLSSAVIGFSNQTQNLNDVQVIFDQGSISNITGQQHGFFIKIQNSQLTLQNMNKITNEEFQQSTMQSYQSLIFSQNSSVNITNCTVKNQYMETQFPLFIESYLTNTTIQNTQFSNILFSKSLVSIQQGSLQLVNSTFVDIQQYGLPLTKRMLQGNMLPVYDNSLIISSSSNVQISGHSMFYNIQCINKCSGTSLQLRNSIFNIEDTIFQNQKGSQGGIIQIVSPSLDSINRMSRCIFLNNTSYQDGGALSLYSYVGNRFNIVIFNSTFIENHSIQGYGGALYINSESLNDQNQIVNIQKSILVSNSAVLGGAVYTKGISVQIDENSKIAQNQASQYGKNLFNYPSQLYFVNQNEFLEQNINSRIVNDHLIVLENFKSGQNLSTILFQMVDDKYELVIPQPQEDPYYVQIKISNETQNADSFYIRGQQNASYIINQIPQLSFVTFDEVQVIGIPGSVGIVDFYSDQLRQIDPKTNKFIQNYKFQIKIHFRNCLAGEYINKYNNYQECQNCPQGTYSIDPKGCLDCPEGGICQEGSSLRCKEGYWRSSEFDDQLIQCTYSEANCVGGTYGNNVCKRGSIGALCQECDVYGYYWNEQYSKSKNQYECALCFEQNKQLAKIIFINIWTIFSLWFSVQKNEESILMRRTSKLLSKYFTKSQIDSKNSMPNNNENDQKKQYCVQKNDFVSNKAGIYIKLFMNYIFIISSLSQLNLNFSKAITGLPSLIGKPLDSSVNTIECFLVDLSTSIPIIYLKLMFSLAIPVFHFLLYITYLIIEKKTIQSQQRVVTERSQNPIIQTQITQQSEQNMINSTDSISEEKQSIIYSYQRVLLLNLTGVFSIQCPNLVVYQSCALFQQFTPLNFLLIPKTSIILINTSSVSSQQNNIIYYVDLQSVEFQVLNAIKSPFEIKKMLYVEQNDLILIWNQGQVLLANPYNLTPIKQTALYDIQNVDLIQNSQYALITTIDKIYLIEQNNLEIIRIMDISFTSYSQSLRYQYTLYFQNSKQQDVLLVICAQGIQIWTLNLNTLDLKFYGNIPDVYFPELSQDQSFGIKHPNYDLIIVGSQYLCIQIIQVNDVYRLYYPIIFKNNFLPNNPDLYAKYAVLIPKNKDDPQSKDTLLVSFGNNILQGQLDFFVDQDNNVKITYQQFAFINQPGGYGWYYLQNLQKILIGFYYSAYLYDIKANTKEDILQLASDAHNRRYIIEYENQEYFVYINPNGFFVADRNYQNRKIQKKNNPPFPYILKQGAFFQVKGCPLCFIIVCSGGNIQDTANIFIATTKIFPIQSPYQIISLAPHKIQGNYMTLNLDPFFYNDAAWVVIGVSYNFNNMGCIFMLLNLYDQNIFFCLNTNNQNENNLESMYAIASLQDLKKQEIVGVIQQGALFRWDLETKQFIEFIVLDGCQGSLSGNMYHYVKSDQSIQKYFIAVCQNFNAQVVNMQNKQIQILSQSIRAQSSTVSVFESIGLIAIGSNNGQAYLFRFNDQSSQFDFFMQIGSQKLLDQIIFIQLVSPKTLWIQHSYRDVYYPIDTCLQDVNYCINCSYDFYFNVNETQLQNQFFGNGEQNQPFTSSNNIFTALLKFLVQNFTMDNCQFDPGFSIMGSTSDISFIGKSINITNNNTTDNFDNQNISSLFSAGQFNLENVNIINNNFKNIKIFSTMPSLIQSNYTFQINNIYLQSNFFQVNTQQILFSALYTQLSEPDHNFILDNGNFFNNTYSSLNKDVNSSQSDFKSFLIQTEKIKNIQISNINFINHHEISLIEMQFSTQINASALNCYDFPIQVNQINTTAGCLNIQNVKILNLDLLQFYDKISLDYPLLIINNQQYQNTQIQITSSIFKHLQLSQTQPSAQVNPLHIISEGQASITIQNCTFKQNTLVSPRSVLVYSVTSLWIQNVEGQISIKDSKFLNCSSNSLYNNMYIQSTDLSIQDSTFDYSSFQYKDQLIQSQETQNILNEGGFLRGSFQNLKIQNSQFSNSISSKGSIMYLESFSQILDVMIQNTNFTSGYSIVDGSAFYLNLPSSTLIFKCMNCNFLNFYNFQQFSSVFAINNLTQSPNTQQILFDKGKISNITGFQYGYFIKVLRSQLILQNIDNITNIDFFQTLNQNFQSLIFSQNSSVTITNCLISNQYMKRSFPLIIDSFFSQITLQQAQFTNILFYQSLVSIQSGSLLIVNSSFINISQYQIPFSRRMLLDDSIDNNQNTLIKAVSSNLVIRDNSLFYNVQCTQKCSGTSLQLINSNIQVENTTFQNSKGFQGGVIQIDNPGLNNIYKFDGCSFLNNQCQYNGCVFNIHSYIGNIYQIIISNSKFIENKSINGKGGALYIYSESMNDKNQVIRIQKSTFIYNSANLGGAIYSRGIYPQIDSNSTIAENKAFQYGQNIFNYPTQLNFVNLNEFLQKNLDSRQIDNNLIVLDNFKSGQGLSEIIFQMLDNQNQLVLPQPDEDPYYVYIKISNQTQNISNYYVRGQQNAKYVLNEIPQNSFIIFDQVQIIGIPGTIGYVEFYSDKIYQIYGTYWGQQYSKSNHQYECALCSESDKQYITIVLINIWTIYSLIFSVQKNEQSILMRRTSALLNKYYTKQSFRQSNLSKLLNRKQNRIFSYCNQSNDFISNKAGVYIKLFMNYIFIISSLSQFNLKFPKVITGFPTLMGRPVDTSVKQNQQCNVTERSHNQVIISQKSSPSQINILMKSVDSISEEKQSIFLTSQSKFKQMKNLTKIETLKQDTNILN